MTIVEAIEWQHEWCLIYEKLLGHVSPKKMYRKQVEDAKGVTKRINETSPDTINTVLYGQSNGPNNKKKKFEFHKVK